MSPTWSLRFFAILAAIVLSIYLLLPTALGLKDKRAALEAAGQPLPWYFHVLPASELNWGLDLRGGVYVEMDVAIADAQKQELNVLTDELKRYFLKGLLASNEIHNVDNRYLRVEVPAGKADEVKTEMNSYLRNRYGKEAVSLQDTANDIFLKIKGTDVDQTRKSLSEALKANSVERDVVSTHGKKYLAVTFKDKADKEQLEAALAKPELAALVEPKAVNDVFYVTFKDDFFTTLHRSIIEQAANAVRNRIDRYGLAEASVSRQGGDRLIVELPGAKNPDDVISIVRRTGNLEFRLVNDKISQDQLEKLVNDKSVELKLTLPYKGQSLDQLNDALKTDLPENTEVLFELRRDESTKKVVDFTPYLVSKDAQVTGKMLDLAKVEYDYQTSEAYVSMRFNKSGAKAFGDVTSANVGKRFAIVLDNIVNSAPVIRSAITGGEARIDIGQASDDAEKEARELTLVLKEGALPAKLEVASKNIIGPSLGRDSIDAGFKSVLVSSAFVILFMLLYYRLSGMVANLALILNLVFLFAILCLFQASVTLPGLAGIALTVGMAVDANVIIFERMREEKYMGHAPNEVVETGYASAMSAIIDGNITTFIAGVVLFQYGTGPIKGFATTLMIGIITTMFSAIIVTKVIFEWLVNGRKVKALGI